MPVDLTKLILESDYNTFQNRTIYTGTRSISGVVDSGTNIQTFTVPLDDIPSMVDIVFNGPTDTVGGTDPRPSDGWFKQGKIWVLGTGAVVGPNYPTPWVVYGNIVASTLTITCTYVQTFVDAITLTETNFSYRVIDYSVFG